MQKGWVKKQSAAMFQKVFAQISYSPELHELLLAPCMAPSSVCSTQPVLEIVPGLGTEIVHGLGTEIVHGLGAEIVHGLGTEIADSISRLNCL